MTVDLWLLVLRVTHIESTMILAMAVGRYL